MIKCLLEPLEKRFRSNVFIYNFSRDLQGVWIDGFTWSSANKIMNQNCQSLDPQLPITLRNNAYSGFLCVFYNFTDNQLHTDGCDEQRPFLCESLSDGKIIFMRKIDIFFFDYLT